MLARFPDEGVPRDPPPPSNPPGESAFESASPPRTDWRHRGALGAILLFAALLRVVYGWPQPDAMRAIDERFSLENVEALLRTRSFTPLTAYHPSVSFLPQTAALGFVEACGCLRLGTNASRVLEEKPGWTIATAKRGRGRSGVRPIPGLTALAYRSCRLLQALFGTATVFLAYVLGRRLMSPAVGLGAALVAAGVPRLIWASGICNEEAVFVLMCLVVALATLRVCQLPTTSRFAWLGVACGVALAAKLNAGPASLPIAFWVAARRREWRQAIPRLILAGAIAAGTFLALNPHYLTRFEIVRRDFSVTVRLYESKGKRQGSSKPYVLAKGALSALSRDTLGPLAGGAALAGAILLARKRRNDTVGRAARVTVALGFPVSYLVLFALATRNASSHSWLPLMPFFAVLAATTADALWRLSPRPLGAGAVAVRAASRLAALAILCAPAVSGARAVYRATVVPTVLVGKGILDRVAAERAFVGVEPKGDHAFVGERQLERVLIVSPKGSRQLTSEARERLDGWIEPALGKERRDGTFESPPDAQAEIVRPALFARRGPALLVVWRPWQRVDSARLELLTPEAPSRWSFRAAPAPIAGAPFASLRLWPARLSRARNCWLRSSSRPVIELLAPAGSWRRGGPNAFVESERYSAREAASLVLHCRSGKSAVPAFSPQVEIVSWNRSTADDG